MFSAGAIPVIEGACSVGLPLVGIVGWLIGWLLHGLGGPGRPFLWLGLFAAAIVPGWALADAFGAAEAGSPTMSPVSDPFWVGAPLIDVLWVGVPVLLVVGLLTGFRRAGGTVVVGLSLPWVMISVADAVGLAQGLRPDPVGTLAQLAAGLLPLAIGIVSVVRGDPTPAPHPAAPPGRPGSRRTGSMTRRLLAEAAYGQPGPAVVVAAAAWALARMILHASPEVAVASGMVALGLAAEAELRWVPPQVLAALEAFHDIGLTALARFKVEVGRQAPTGSAGLAAWLASAPDTPDTLPARIEILTGFGRWEEAHQLLERFEPAAPTTAFRKAVLAADLVWRQGGPARIEELRVLAAAIGPADDPARAAAEGQLAWFESEVRLAALDPDWKHPLLAYRARVPYAAGLHARSMRRRAWQGTVLPMAAVILMVSIADAIPAWRS